MEETADSLELVEVPDVMDLVPRWEIPVWWYFGAAGLVLLVVALVFLIRRKKTESDPMKEKREAYRAAKKQFQAIQDGSARELAIEVSLILRKYLAKTLGESALFETHEEFIGRDESLANLPEETRAAVSVFFGKLVAVKYGPEEAATDGFSPAQADFVTEGMEILERIHNQ